MSPESYSWETIESAEELYILDGLTFEAVAERTGVSVSQLKRWSADCTISWPDRRREYRQAQVSVRRGVMLAKARLIESVIETEDPQKAYAFGSLVNSARLVDAEARDRIAGQQTGATTDQPGNPPGQQFATMAEAILALQQAVQLKISGMLTLPGSLSFAAIKDTKAAMEMIDQLGTKYAAEQQTSDKCVGLTAQAAEAIRRQILGLTEDNER